MAMSLALCYHAVSRDWPSTLAVSPEQLRGQLTGLLRRGYRGVTFSELVLGGTRQKRVAVTFDDGCQSVVGLALPILRELGVPATIFVPTAFVGDPKPMSWPGIDQWTGTEYERELRCVGWDQLRGLLDEGWEVGSHTRSHPYLTDLDDESLAVELGDSRETCRRELGAPCASLAYPYGDHDRRVVAAARAAGYRAAGTMRPGPAEPLRWPRIGVFPADLPWRFRLKSSPTVARVRASALGRRLERSRQGRR
ncbi:MAG: polysaccharide deacetylase family protein [Solirubrobacterales bacterium]